MNKVKPISPEEIIRPIPDMVIESFNELINKNFDGYSSHFLANDIVNLIENKMQCKRNEIYSKGYLNIESIYQANGWMVKYEQPSIGDDFPAYFNFTKK